MKELTKFKKIISLIVMIFFFNIDCISIENKIIYKIDNEILTSIDLNNEINYLLALNPNLKQLSNEEIIKISKNSLIREKIKRVEISNHFKKVELPQKILENLIKNIYKKVNINNLNDFKKYLKENNVEYRNMLSKIETEALWNQLIFSKFSKKVKIDEEKLRKEIILSKTLEKKSYLMSEIVFEVSKKNEINKKYQEILKSISVDGFNNAALKYSISETANIGGKLDWISESSLNKKISNILKTLQINEYTKPIPIAGSFIILKINDIKISKSDKNIENELKKLITQNSNSQLNQFSKIYFNKIKEDIKIDEI